MDERIRNKLLLWSGIICTICGVLILVTSLLDLKSLKWFAIFLGACSIFNGVIFLYLSKRK